MSYNTVPYSRVKRGIAYEYIRWNYQYKKMLL